MPDAGAVEAPKSAGNSQERSGQVQSLVRALRLLQEVAEVVLVAAVGVAVTTAPLIPPAPKPPEVCHPPGVSLYDRSFKCCRP